MQGRGQWPLLLLRFRSLTNPNNNRELLIQWGDKANNVSIKQREHTV